jgi:hypothetical protein
MRRSTSSSSSSKNPGRSRTTDYEVSVCVHLDTPLDHPVQIPSQSSKRVARALMARIASGDDDVQQQVTSTRSTIMVSSITLLRRLVKTGFPVHELMVAHRFSDMRLWTWPAASILCVRF